MDARAKTALRLWLMGAATAGIMGQGLLSGQVDRPASKLASRKVGTAARVAATPPRLEPVPLTIDQVAYEDGDPVAQSEVEQRLRELYERDGREMPEMRLAPAAANPQATAPQPAPAQAGAPRALPTPPRYSSAPSAPPPAKPQNKVTSFFKKIIPGGKKTQAQTPPLPPRQLPAAGSQQPLMQAAAPQAAAAPAASEYANQPQEIAPAAAQPNRAAAAATSVSFGNPVRVADPVVTPQATAVPVQPVDLVSPDDENDLDLDEPAAMQEADEFFETEPVLQPPAPAEIAAPKLEEEEFNPFGEESERTAAPTDSAEPANPFSGMTLDEPDAPAELSEEPAPKAEIPANDPTVDESTATKMRRIIQRTDMKGLKGFCPVTLRDQRELADSRPEFVASFRGQKFYFASKVAQAKFEADPARYAPAAYGADVVVLTDDQDVVEGTLDFAAWYKGRLYLFGTQANHDQFVENPERYASPPGIE